MMKIPEQYAGRVVLTSYIRPLAIYDGPQYLFKLIGNAITGELQVESANVGAQDDLQPVLGGIVNPGALAQFCAAYLAKYHDVIGMR